MSTFYKYVQLEFRFRRFFEKWSKLVPALASGVFAFALYLVTLAPGLYTEDAGDFQTAALTLGIPHPSGYPGYVMLANLWSRVAGHSAFAVNAFSALAGAVAVVLLFQVARELKVRILPALAGALALAVSLTWWRQSIVAEVYSLNGVAVMGILWLAIRWYNTKRVAFLYGLAFVYGLALTNHYMLLAVAPAMAVFSIVCAPSEFKRWRTWGGIIAYFILGLLPYLFLPLRSRMHPKLNWLDPENFSHLTYVLKYNAPTSLKTSLDTLHYLATVAGGFVPELGVLVCLAGLVGLGWLLWNERRLGWFMVAYILLGTIGVACVITQGSPVTAFVAWFLNILYVPVYALWCVLAAYTLHNIREWLRAVFGSTWWGTGVGAMFWLAVAVALVAQLLVNYPVNDRSKEVLVDSYVRSILTSLPPKAVLVVQEPVGFNTDTLVFNFAYLQYVEGIRTDVTVFTNGPVFPLARLGLRLPTGYEHLEPTLQSTVLVHLAWDHFKPLGSPIYTSSPVDYLLGQGFRSYSNGLVFELRTNSDSSVIPKKYFELPYLTSGLMNDVSLKTFGVKVAYAQAAYSADQGQPRLERAAILWAITVDPEPFSVEYQTYLNHRAWVRGAR